MSCERPGGPIIDRLLFDANIKFPPNFSGELPPGMTREQLREQMAPVFSQRGLSAAQVEEALDFLVEYEGRYYEVVGASDTFHRPCGGGAMVQGRTGVFCAKCGQLPDLLPPECMR